MKSFIATAFTAASMALSSGAQLPDPKSFFESLAARPSRTDAPTYQQTLQVIDQIQTLDQQTLVQALPAIFTALRMSDEAASTDAAFALTSVARRADSGAILQPYINAIGDLLNRTDARLNGAAVLILNRMHPALPKESEAPMLIAFLSSNQGAPEARPDAISALLKLAPNDPAVTQAITGFMSQPLDLQIRVAAVLAMKNASQDNTALVKIVLAAISDQNPYVVKAGIQSARIIGSAVLSQARPRLLQLVNDQSQPRDLRKRAEQALGMAPTIKDVP